MQDEGMCKYSSLEVRATGESELFYGVLGIIPCNVEVTEYNFNFAHARSLISIQNIGL